MKHPVLFVTLIAAVALSAGAAERPSAFDPSDMIRSFYHWYVPLIMTNHDPMKNRAGMKRFVTDRLLNEIEKTVKGPDGLDGDYFVDAQDFDNKWATNIAVSNVKTHGTKARADVLLTGSGEMNKELSLSLVNTGGAWKIDKVEGHE